jgi:hypothetical protein
LCYMSCPSHPPWLDHSNYTRRRVQAMKCYSVYSQSNCNSLYTLSVMAWTDILKLLQEVKIIRKFYNGNWVLPIKIFLLCFILLVAVKFYFRVCVCVCVRARVQGLLPSTSLGKHPRLYWLI